MHIFRLKSQINTFSYQAESLTHASAEWERSDKTWPKGSSVKALITSVIHRSHLSHVILTRFTCELGTLFTATPEDCEEWEKRTLICPSHTGSRPEAKINQINFKLN